MWYGEPKPHMAADIKVTGGVHWKWNNPHYKLYIQNSDPKTK